MTVKTRTRRKGKIDNDRTDAVIPQHTNDKEDSSKIEVLEEYYNYDSMRLVPITVGTLERLIENGKKWAKETDNAFTLSQWRTLNGIHESTWERWEDKHPFFREGTEYILGILGDRREIGLLNFKLQPQATMYMMTHYSKAWKRNAEWRSNLNKKESDAKGQQIVVIEKVPDSPLVPVRKTDIQKVGSDDE